MVATAAPPRSRAIVTRWRTCAVDSTVCDRKCTCPHRIHLHPQVHPVQQRSRKLAQIAAFDHRRADAVLRIGGRAWARVGRQDQLESRRVAGHPVATSEANFAVLQRCTQCFQRPDADLSAFVEKQHPAVRPTDRARTRHSGAAADECRNAGTVMRRHEWRPGDQRRIARQQPRYRVNCGDLQRLGVRQRRQQSRKSLRQHRFAHPRRTRST